MIDSPCVRNCCLDPQDVCLGCGRHLNEITGWQQATDEKKRQILQNAKERLEQRSALQIRRRAADRPE